MPIEINNTPFEVDGSRFTMVCASPVVVNGMILRLFNYDLTAQTYTYTDTSLAQVTVSVPASGSVGNPLYVLAASSSAADSFSNITTISAIRLLITGSSVGNAFTEELITATGAGSWTKPAGVTEVIVECWGAGGAGGGATGNPAAGAGGGGGQYSRKLVLYPSAQSTLSYTVATGGVGSTIAGTDGGDSTWETNVVVAKGGTGGGANATSVGLQIPGGIGNAEGSIGDVIYFGEDGGLATINDIPTINPSPGTGGGAAGSTGPSISPDSAFGIQDFGGARAPTPEQISANGINGAIYGGGGSGASKTTGPNRSGGDGAQGLIRLIYR